MYSKRVVPTNDNDKDIITYIYEQVFYKDFRFPKDKSMSKHADII